MKYCVRSVEVTDSTNSDIKRGLERSEIDELPFVLTAEMQTAGRGRFGKEFYSPKGGLYFSAAFAASQVRFSADLLTVAVGVAVSLAIESKCGGKAEVKWVNDILYGGKKVCGVLCESVRSERHGDTVYIVGVGVNTCPEALGDFMPEKVGALRLACPNSELMHEILARLCDILERSDTQFLSHYNERLGLRGKTIEILVRGKAERAEVECVEAEGLKCRLSGGEYAFVRSYGEILSDLYEV